MSNGDIRSYRNGNNTHSNKVASEVSLAVVTSMEGGLPYTQAFDAESKLISVKVSGKTSQFIYDSDGDLVKKIKPDGSKTLYIGGICEVDKNSAITVSSTKIYYPVAGAMRVNGKLYFVLKDHLGSAVS